MESRIHSTEAPMVPMIVRRTGSAVKRNGYTLIELVIVMAIISVLLMIAVPFYQKSIVSTKESLLKNNLFTLRTVIDEYTFDKNKARPTGSFRPMNCGRRRSPAQSDPPSTERPPVRSPSSRCPSWDRWEPRADTPG